jgi:7-cyano-7-deazaguanine synthase
MKAVALLSGGMDSATLAYQLRSEGHELHLLSVFYGQRHACELRAARQIAEAVGAASHKVIDLGVLRELLSASALTGDTPVPHGHYEAPTMKLTVVPNRNAIMLAIAFGYAVTIGAEVVGYAAHAGDHAVYPDCRQEFALAFGDMQQQALYQPAPRLDAPFINQSKAQIAAIGARLGVPYALTWSCYEGGDTHCGKCGTCVERREAFELAGVADPTTYAA